MEKQQLLIVALVCSAAIMAVSCGSGEIRKVSVEWNPDCDGTTSSCNGTNARGSYTNLVHVELTGASDVIHLLYSDIGAFSMVFARTNLTSKLSVNWTLLLSGDKENMSKALTFSQAPVEWFAYEIASIYEFDDVNGTADMTKAGPNETYTHLTEKFIWKKFQFNTTENFGWFEG